MARVYKSVGLIATLALLVTLAATVGAFALTVEEGTERAAMLAGSQARSESIIVDHTSTDLSVVPDYWIERARSKFIVYYAHTSHGSQLMSGLDAVGKPQPPIHEVGDDLGHAGDTSWVAPTRTYLDAHPETNVVMWSWCGGVSDNTEWGINTYLSAVNQLESDYPGVTFVYMTGHLDGDGIAGNLNVRNNQIRAYAQANDKVLFDFADIESYDPDGSEFLSRLAWDSCAYDGDGDGDSGPNDPTNWADEWCADHSSDPLCGSCSCSHSKPLNCQLKGRAVWWMLARIAGWGEAAETNVSKTASADRVEFGDIVTYTIAIQEHAAPSTTTLYLTDNVPSGLVYVPGSLTATTGLVTDTAAPELRWSGVLSPSGAATVTYALRVSTVGPEQISNQAIIAAPGYDPVTPTAVITVLYSLNLPDLEPSYKAVSISHADYGERITYTIEIRNARGPMTDTLTMTDTLPPELTYVTGTMTATLGVVDDTDAPTLTWSGVLSPTPYATVRFEARVEISESRRVENLALIARPSRRFGNVVVVGLVYMRQASLIVNGVQSYLPCIIKNRP